jgi:hypothetical protein
MDSELQRSWPMRGLDIVDKLPNYNKLTAVMANKGTRHMEQAMNVGEVSQL